MTPSGPTGERAAKHLCVIDAVEYTYDGFPQYIAVCLKTGSQVGGAAMDSWDAERSFAKYRGENAVLRAIRYLDSQCRLACHEVIQ